MELLRKNNHILIKIEKYIDKIPFLIEALILSLLFLSIWYIQPLIFRPLHSDFYSDSQFLFYEYFKINKLSFLIGCLIISYSIFLSFWKQGLKWSLEPKWVKAIVLTCVFLLAWAYGISETNFFYNKAYIFDKLLLLILAVVSFLRPQFVFVFLLQAYLLSKQFAYALPPTYTFTDKQIIYDILFGFSFFLGLKNIFLKRVSWYLFLVMVLLIFCNWYFKAGLGKIIVGWQSHNALYNLFMASTAYDWLYQFPKLKSLLGSSLYQMKGIIEYLTLLVEFVFPLILLLKRNWFKYVLMSFIVFHILVYLTSGIFFWKWIVLEIALIIISYKSPEMLSISKQMKVIYVIFLPLLFLFSPTASLVWYDTPFLQKHEFYLVSGSEERKLDASFFSPYDVIFAQNRFSFLSQRPTYTRTYGSTTDLNTLIEANEALTTTSPKFTSSVVVEYDRVKKDVFINFVNKFVKNKLENDVKWVNWLDAPMHIHQGENQQNFNHTGGVDSLKIVYKELLTLPDLTFRQIYSNERMIKLH